MRKPEESEAQVDAAFRSTYLAARWASIHSVRFCIGVLIRTARLEQLAVGLKYPALSSPPVEQPWIVLEL